MHRDTIDNMMDGGLDRHKTVMREHQGMLRGYDLAGHPGDTNVQSGILGVETWTLFVPPSVVDLLPV